MNWDAVGAIAELGGAIGVIATLIYLSIQIRQNSALVESTRVAANRASRNDITTILVTNERANRVFWSGLESRAALSDEDKRIFDPLMTLLVQAWQESLELGFWGQHREDRIFYIEESPGFVEFWQVHRMRSPPAFRAEMDREIVAAQQPTAADSA